MTVADFSVTPDPGSAPAGDITFDITNDAEQTHEFVVFKTDLAADQLPTDENGDVDEAGEGVEHVDEVEDIEGGSTQSLTVNLDAGSYVLICNLPGHYGQGMHASFTRELRRSRRGPLLHPAGRERGVASASAGGVTRTALRAPR